LALKVLFNFSKDVKNIKEQNGLIHFQQLKNCFNKKSVFNDIGSGFLDKVLIATLQSFLILFSIS
jgi:hypothetical protein